MQSAAGGWLIVEKSILIIILAAVCEDSGFFYALTHGLLCGLREGAVIALWL